MCNPHGGTSILQKMTCRSFFNNAKVLWLCNAFSITYVLQKVRFGPRVRVVYIAFPHAYIVYRDKICNYSCQMQSIV
jgi:hypothetical protein